MASASFIAIIPDIQSAIKIGKDGARITLEIPESDLAKFLPVVTMRGRLLNVKITAD